LEPVRFKWKTVATFLIFSFPKFQTRANSLPDKELQDVKFSREKSLG